MPTMTRFGGHRFVHAGLCQQEGYEFVLDSAARDSARTPAAPDARRPIRPARGRRCDSIRFLRFCCSLRQRSLPARGLGVAAGPRRCSCCSSRCATCSALVAAPRSLAGYAMGRYAALPAGITSSDPRRERDEQLHAMGSLVGLGPRCFDLCLECTGLLRVTHINYDSATEYLVYAHASPDVKRAAETTRSASDRLCAMLWSPMMTKACP